MIPRRVQWKLACRNALRNRRRSVICGLLVGACFAAMLLQQAYGYRFERHLIVNSAFNNYTGHVSLYLRGGLDHHLEDVKAYLIPDADVARLTKILGAMPDVEFVGQYLVGAGLISNGCKSIAFVGLGVDPAVDGRVQGHPQLDRWHALASPHSVDLLRHPAASNPVTVTPLMARRLGKPKVKEQFPAGHQPSLFVDCERADSEQIVANDAEAQILAYDATGDFNVIDATIVQHHSTGRIFTEDTALKAPLPMMRGLLHAEGATYLGIFLRNGVDPEDFIDRFQAALPESERAAYELFPALSKDLNPMDQGTIAWQTTVDFFLLSLLGLITSLSIYIFLAMTVAERRHEVGVMRVLGFSPRLVFSIFHKEFTLIALAGLGAGAVMTAVAAYGVNVAAIPYRPPGLAGDMLLLIDVSPGHALYSAAAIFFFAVASSAVTTRVFAARDNIFDLFAHSS